MFIADDLIKERMDVVHKYDEVCFDSIINDFILKETSKSEVENDIKNVYLNKSSRSDVPSIRFVKKYCSLFS